MGQNIKKAFAVTWLSGKFLAAKFLNLVLHIVFKFSIYIYRFDT